ncbi:ArpU family phage packaging/lysis transcriptional regulator [Oenococcus oeni]|uniref:ArpU family phage packaging/lysis transcriptional regulator n=1 Tax=Oenococcus oeni TaxID=1247 RepID=UPI00050FF6A9|nr:ArpU family phage packaging/lysis transcriptional regulator [Oenococcus oeni]KGH98052.1 hypothetical protein X283_05800 [Oenococcus oeni IOEB_1491]
MEQTSLLDEVDEKATIENVRSFFKSNHNRPSKFERLVAQAGTSTDDLKSSIWSDMPKSVSVENSQENKVFRRMEAQSQLQACLLSIKNIPLKYRRLFISYYVDNIYHDRQWTDVSTAHGYSRTEANEHMNKALLWFADAYVGEYDFHIYKKADKHTTNVGLA